MFLLRAIIVQNNLYYNREIGLNYIDLYVLMCISCIVTKLYHVPETDDRFPWGAHKIVVSHHNAKQSLPSRTDGSKEVWQQVLPRTVYRYPLFRKCIIIYE